MGGSTRLTDAEMAFLTARILEGFHLDDLDHPACEAYRNLGLSRDDTCKDFEFKYLWQEQGQIDIMDPETGLTIPASPAPCPWSDAATFLRRWHEILPEILARDFEKNHNLEHYRSLIRVRPEIWGEVEVNSFTPNEAEFLDALADEVRSRASGPCLQTLVARKIPHFQTLSLIERRWFELDEQGRSWPQPHRPDTACPWQDRQAFNDRFDHELNPHLHYPMTESWKASIRRSTPDRDATESGPSG
jgi:hypothetical protein